MTRSAGGRRRSTAVTVSLAAWVAAGLTGCSSGPDYQGVCVEPQTQRRVEDDNCRNDSSGGTGRWVYYRNGSHAPAVGEAASGGSSDVPHGASVSRGGFGRSGGVVGG